MLAINLPWLTNLERPTRARRIPSVLVGVEVASLLGALKVELRAKARGAFQALAGLKLAKDAAAAPVFKGNQTLARVHITKAAIKNVVASAAPAGQRHTAWTFGELPELLEIQKSDQTLNSYPALIDGGDAFTVEVFGEPMGPVACSTSPAI